MAARDKDAALLASVRSFMAETKMDDKLEEKAIGKIKVSAVLKNVFKTTYTNGVTVIISSNYDLFNIDISEPSLYMDTDTNYTPMSIDRVKWYINRIIDYV